MTRALRIGIVAVLMGPAGASPAAGSTEPEHWDYSLSATTMRTSAVGLDASGETRLSSQHLRAGAERRVNPSTELGINVSYDYFDRDFPGAGAVGALQHLSETNGVGISGFLSRRTRFGWSYGVRPYVNWAFESGAFSDDAMSYGTALAVMAGLSAGRRIGAGVSVSRRMEGGTKATPIVIVHWELNESWTLANPREANFSSPAGLEIRYRSGSDWWIALAGIYHSNDYRLDDRGFAAGGIGESSGILSYIRTTYRWASWLSINGYAGAIFDGELEVEDVNGNTLVRSGYDTAPFLALSIEGKF